VEYAGFLIPLLVVFALGVAVLLKKLLNGRPTLKKKGNEFFGS
jgi:hypothetical protein